MKNFLLIFILSFICINNNSFSSEEITNALHEGNKLIFIRHAYAPGTSDPNNFNLEDCSSQRNLNIVGIKQAERIGLFFKKNNIKIDKVLSSQWCRCKDTAKYAFENYNEFSALNSIFQSPFDKNEDKQLKQIREFVDSWQGNGKNLIMITHFSIIAKVTNSTPSSGEIIIVNKNFKILERISTLEMGFFYQKKK